ncbi:MAG TPA: hypothetical protein VMS88_03475 [Terriglobales bacterium]|nr:hypothetical protein [Terriglobales bacterium]
MRADSSGVRGRWLTLLLALLLLVGATDCGRRHGSRPLSFEEVPDTAGLSHGAPIITSFQPQRITGNAVLVRGSAALPDGARLQIRLVRARTGEVVYVTQVTVQDRAFETGAIFGPDGPLPVGLYRFELSAYFDPASQPASVLRATRDGTSLRGPGVTRARRGQPAFFLREETRL